MLEKIKNIDLRYRVTIGLCFIWSIIAHGTVFFNKFAFHDEVESIFGVGTTYPLGRWGLGLFKDIFTFVLGELYSTPVFYGFFSIFCISIITCFLISLFNIYRISSIVVISGIMVTLPAITGLFGFMYTAPYYLIGLLITVSGVFLLINKKNIFSYLAAIVFISFGCSVYQAYFCFGLGTVYMYEFVELLDGKKSIKHFIIDCFFYILINGGALLSYLGINKLFLARHGIELSSYAGINEMGKHSITEYFHKAIIGYKAFLVPDASLSYNMYPMSTRNLFRVIIIILVFLVLCKCIKIVKESVLRVLLIIGMLGFLPLAINFIFVISEPHSLMMYSHVLIYIFLITQLENFEIKKQKLKQSLFEIGISCVFLLSILFSYYSNACYLTATLRQSQAISQFNTLITRIKSIEGYDDSLAITYIDTSSKNSPIEINELEKIEIVPYIYSSEIFLDSYSWKSFMRLWCGYAPNEVSASSFKELEEVIDMPLYPNDGSIKIINDTVVVKF